MDISGDLIELSRTPVTVICAGAKSILDVPRTLEFLETYNVPVIGFNCDKFPEFFFANGENDVKVRLNTEKEVAEFIHMTHDKLKQKCGILVAVPVPEEAGCDKTAIKKAISEALEDFKINKEKMMKEIMANKEIGSNVDIMLRNYIYDKIYMSTEDLFLLDLHNVFNIEKEKKAPLVSLFRYEIFLYLYPGSFFGDAALETKIKKRNASIRTEEDCIICSLSNEYYISLIAEENKKLRIIDLQFLLNNFFFHEISPNIFNRYYFPMFKLSERKKKDVIFKSNEKLSSVFLLKDGIIKTEIKINVKDLINLIKKIIKALYLKSNNLKITLEQIMELKKTYLKDDLVLESKQMKMMVFKSPEEEAINEIPSVKRKTNN